MYLNGWMVKQTVVHPYNEILFSSKKQLLIHAKNWMDLKVIMLSEKSQSQEVPHCVTPLIDHSFFF